MNHRSERVANLIQEELSAIIQRELDFEGALVTLTRVEVDTKLESAAVRVGVIPSDRADATLKTLAARAGALQHLLNRKLNIKPMPRIAFERDRGAESAAEVERLLKEAD